MTQSSPLLTAPIGRTIIRLAAPNMLSMVVTMATLMAEAWYVGQLGRISRINEVFCPGPFYGPKFDCFQRNLWSGREKVKVL